MSVCVLEKSPLVSSYFENCGIQPCRISNTNCYTTQPWNFSIGSRHCTSRRWAYGNPPEPRELYAITPSLLCATCTWCGGRVHAFTPQRVKPAGPRISHVHVPCSVVMMCEQYLGCVCPKMQGTSSTCMYGGSLYYPMSILK